MPKQLHSIHICKLWSELAGLQIQASLLLCQGQKPIYASHAACSRHAMVLG